MEGTNPEELQPLPDHIPIKWTKEEVAGRLTDEELVELNTLVDQFADFTGEEDPRYKRWIELDTKADVLKNLN